MYLTVSYLNLDAEKRLYKPRLQDPQRVIDTFQRTGWRQAELVFTCHEYRDAHSCRSTLAKAIERMHATHIRVRTLNDRVYLINTLIDRNPATPPARHNFYGRRRKQ